MFKLILSVLFLIIFFIISIPVYLILFIIGLFNRHARDVVSQCIVKYAFKIILFICGIKIKVSGLSNIPKDQAVLYVANHNGFFDILAGYTTLPNVTGFVSKQEIKKVPFLNWWMYFVNCLFFDRSNMKAAVKMILAGVERLKNGISIFIFPEGTRSKDKKVGEFKEGSFKMATKANVPIIPVAITGTAQVFEDHFPKITKGTINICYCAPIIPSDYTKDELKHIGSKARDIIIDNISPL